MASSILTVLGISAEAWRSIPQEDKDRITQAVKAGSIDAAKNIAQTSLATLEVTKRMLGIGNPHSKGIMKEIITKLVKEGTSRDFFGLGPLRFDIRGVASKLEFRGHKGEDFWASELIEMVFLPYREHVKGQGIDEAQVDDDLKFLSERIGVPIDKLRKQFYIFEFEKPAKEEPKAPQKVEPTRTPEGKKEPSEKEEIVLKEGAEE
jgi:hypothetical protein